jgi:hypothetical protein
MTSDRYPGTDEIYDLDEVWHYQVHAKLYSLRPDLANGLDAIPNVELRHKMKVEVLAVVVMLGRWAGVS